jgi:hypothetical protein
VAFGFVGAPGVGRVGNVVVGEFIKRLEIIPFEMFSFI